MAEATAAPVPNPGSAEPKLLTHAEHTAFRTGVIECLKSCDGQTFHGSIRAFAVELSRRHDGKRPFELVPGRGKQDATGRIAGRLKKMERARIIAYTWGQSINYACVAAIRLLDATATEAPKRRVTVPISRTPETRIARRRIEVLECLARNNGHVESVVRLIELLREQFGDDHRKNTVTPDLRELERDGWIARTTHRIEGRPRTAITITEAGTQEVVDRMETDATAAVMEPPPVPYAAPQEPPPPAASAEPEAPTPAPVDPARLEDTTTAGFPVGDTAPGPTHSRVPTRRVFEEEYARVNKRLTELYREIKELTPRVHRLQDIIHRYEELDAIAKEAADELLASRG